MRPVSFIKKVKTVAFLMVLFAVFAAHAQVVTLSGTVVDDANQPLVGATILVKELKKGTSSDLEGKFLLSIQKGTYTIEISYVGFQKLVQEITFDADQSKVFQLSTTEEVLDEVLVSAVRVKADAPVTHSNLTKREIAKRNLGQDIPILMNYLPSVVSSSDAGAGIGYTYIRVRGSDASRVNVTVNGIPYNDSESQGTFWVNMGDFASSTQSLQLQRGVGTSTNGAGAFGASLNLLTDAVAEEAGGEISNSFGSYATRKHTVKFTTGKVNEHFEFAGRLSNIYSDGYIDRAFTDLKSYFLQGAYTDDNTLIKALVFGGKEKTYQAWDGISAAQLKTNRRHNPLSYENETDNFWQDHYQIHWNEKIDGNWSTNVAFNYTRGKGYFEQFKENRKAADYNNLIVTGSDVIVRRWLDNHFYFGSANATYKNDRFEIISGVAYGNFTNDHYGEVIWGSNLAPTTKIRDHYYDSASKKTDVSLFSKATFHLSEKVKAFIDLQGRFVNYKTVGLTSKRKPINVNANFNFFNPKLGFTYAINKRNNLYVSYARANREPNRNDFEGGTSQHESLNDFEFGWRLHTNNIKLNTNVYYMGYQNQLVLTGEIDNSGEPLRATSGSSYRLGLEIDADIRINEQWTVRPNIAVSQNKNIDFYINRDNVLRNLGNTNIAFSPNIIAGNALVYQPNANLQIGFLSKFVGEQYMSNTDTKGSKLESYFISDLNFVYELPIKSVFSSIVFTGLVNNIFNKEYVDRGYIFLDTWSTPGTTKEIPGYYPQATRNFLLGVTLKF